MMQRRAIKPYPFILMTGITLLLTCLTNDAMAYGLTVNPDTLSINGTATAELCGGTTAFTITGVELVDPTGTAHSSSVNVGTTLNAGDCVTWNIPDDFSSTTLNAIGTWVLKINTDPGNQFTDEFNVSIFVVPESILGAIAVASASLITFAGYTVLGRIRRHHK